MWKESIVLIAGDVGVGSDEGMLLQVVTVWRSAERRWIFFDNPKHFPGVKPGGNKKEVNSICRGYRDAHFLLG